MASTTAAALSMSAVFAMAAGSSKPSGPGQTWLSCSGAAKSFEDSRSDGSPKKEPSSRTFPMNFELVVDAQNNRVAFFADANANHPWSRRELHWFDGSSYSHPPTLDADPAVRVMLGQLTTARFNINSMEMTCNCSDAGMQGGHKSTKLSIDRRTLQYTYEYRNTIGPRNDGFFWTLDFNGEGACVVEQQKMTPEEMSGKF